MDKRRHYKDQQKYFDKEFSSVKEYTLAAWQQSYIDRLKKFVLDKNYKKKIMLDIGTGSGYIAVEMAKMGIRVIACDLSTEAVKNLEKYKRKYKLSNLKVIHCKAEDIPLQDNSVDYIVANAILEHIPAEKKAIDKWKDLLRKNGRMYITVPLKFRYIWPFLWIPNYLHDRRIGHLRRYDLSTLENKFALPVKKVFYTGHLIKIFGIVISILTKNNKYDKFIEKLDSKKSSSVYGANNISLVLLKK